MRIAHVITDLEVGGAQVMLRRLVVALQASGVSNAVVSLGGATEHFRDVTATGATLHHLNMTPSLRSGGALLRLTRLLATLKPDVVHTWLYHADLIGGLAARLSLVVPVVWGIHHTAEPSEPLKRRTRVIRRLNSALSSVVPDRILCCSHASKASHVSFGYTSEKMVVVANGFDTDAFSPDPAAAASVRQELGLASDAPLIGSLARFHPQKDHQTWIRAASRLTRERPDVRFLLAGRGVDRQNPTLNEWLHATGAPERFHLLGSRTDMARLMAACDIVASSAACGEGLPLVLGEAMACGVPCVATDVGDSALLVGDAGLVVRPGDDAALAKAWASLLTLSIGERRRLGDRARDRVLSRYQLSTCIREYMGVYEQLVGNRLAHRRAALSG